MAGYYAYIDRESGILELSLDYYIEPYYDPETGEEFGDTSWVYTVSEAGGSSGGTGGYAGSGESVRIDFALMPEEIVRRYTIELRAENRFSGDTYAYDLGLYTGALATTALRISASDGDDLILGGYAGDVVRAGGGDDQIDGGDGADRLVAGDGDDRIDGGAGDDRMHGGRGDDLYLVDDAGDTIVERGGARGGIDTVYARIDYALPDRVEQLVLLGSARIGRGNASANRIEGTSSDDELAGLGGDDYLRGGSGNDLLLGGDGDDTLDAIDYGSGADTLVGGTGNDTYLVDAIDGRVDIVREDSGDGGIDTVASAVSRYALGANVEDLLFRSEVLEGALGIGNALDNRIAGTRYDDDLRGGDGVDTLEGAAGDDLLTGGRGADRLDGGDGVDRVSYAISAAGVQVYLARGRASGGDAAGDTLIAIERIVGSAFADRLRGDDAANALSGGGGVDRLVGGDGDDILNGGAGGDRLIGGAGRDVVSFAGSTMAVAIDLATGEASGGDAAGDRIDGVEGILGSDGDDSLTGDALDNVIVGGAGADTLDGGEGHDRLSYSGSTAVTVDLSTGQASGGDAEGDVIAGFEAVGGGDGDDMLTGDDGANRLDGGLGRDRLVGGGGDDIVAGGAGADAMGGEGGIDTLNYTASGGYVVVYMSEGRGHGNDAEGDRFALFENVIGSRWGDALYGDAGDNRLVGGDGGDYLVGGAGKDVLVGGDGLDVFVYGEGDGHDVILDFASGGSIEEAIEYVSLNLDDRFDTFAEVMAVATMRGGDTVFTFSDTDSLTLKGVNMETIVPQDLGF